MTTGDNTKVARKMTTDDKTKAARRMTTGGKTKETTSMIRKEDRRKQVSLMIDMCISKETVGTDECIKEWKMRI
jgi:hypothetical protein